jgi:hypothetical protein
VPIEHKNPKKSFGSVLSSFKYILSKGIPSLQTIYDLAIMSRTTKINEEYEILENIEGCADNISVMKLRTAKRKQKLRRVAYPSGGLSSGWIKITNNQTH